jgi:hypothetical protein
LSRPSISWKTRLPRGLVYPQTEAQQLVLQSNTMAGPDFDFSSPLDDLPPVEMAFAYGSGVFSQVMQSGGDMLRSSQKEVGNHGSI